VADRAARHAAYRAHSKGGAGLLWLTQLQHLRLTHNPAVEWGGVLAQAIATGQSAREVVCMAARMGPTEWRDEAASVQDLLSAGMGV